MRPSIYVKWKKIKEKQTKKSVWIVGVKLMINRKMWLNKTVSSITVKSVTRPRQGAQTLMSARTELGSLTRWCLVENFWTSGPDFITCEESRRLGVNGVCVLVRVLVDDSVVAMMNEWTEIERKSKRNKDSRQRYTWSLTRAKAVCLEERNQKEEKSNMRGFILEVSRYSFEEFRATNFFFSP